MFHISSQELSMKIYLENKRKLERFLWNGNQETAVLFDSK